MERVGGIEPPCAAWKAAVLPLNYTRRDEGSRAAIAFAIPPQVALWNRYHSKNAARQPWHSDATGACRPSHMWPSPLLAAASACRLGPRAILAPRLQMTGGGMVGEAGFEPAKAEPSDLQSDPFGRSGIPPLRDLAECPGAKAMNAGTNQTPTVWPRCVRSTRKPVQAHVPSPCGEASCSRVIL